MGGEMHWSALIKFSIVGEKNLWIMLTQSPGAAAEYTDCFSAEG